MSPDTPNPAAAAEAGAVAVIRGMLAKPQYLIPLAAAEVQLRAHYYQLNAAALLEDLFHDALTNYVQQFDPATTFERASRGAKGWDYEVAGLRLSHKTWKGGALAAIWDATLKETTQWTFPASLLVVVSTYPKRLSPKGQPRVTALSQHFTMPRAKAPGLQAQDLLMLVQWPARANVARVLAQRVLEQDASEAWAALPFADVWRAAVDPSHSGLSFNEFEVLVARGAVASPEELQFEEETLRPGAYAIPQALLVDVPVSANNRGLLVEEGTVLEWLRWARSNDLFIPMPTWYQAYAEERPPDLYTVQRTEFDALFSARGFRR